jgi:hypothetical protein
MKVVAGASEVMSPVAWSVVTSWGVISATFVAVGVVAATGDAGVCHSNLSEVELEGSVWSWAAGSLGLGVML